jgi:hypothetical protein
MHTEFKVLVDKSDSFNSANFTIAEIDLYLSNAQEEFIEQRAWGNNFKRESIEETQKRVKDLQSLVVNARLSFLPSTLDNKENAFFVALPDGVTVLDENNIPYPKYRHAINEELVVQYVDCNERTKTTRVPVVALTHDKYNTAVTNPFAKPSFNRVYRLPYGRIGNLEHFEIIVSPPMIMTSRGYQLRYLKDPKKIDKAQIQVPLGLPGNAQGDLTDESYREVIAIAVRNALGDIESIRVNDAREKLNEIE